MAVTASITVAHTTTPTLEAAATTLNFLSGNVASGNAANVSNFPVTISNSVTTYSYERWFYLQFAGNTNIITGAYVWKSAGTLVAGYAIKAVAKGAPATTFVTPLNVVSTLATVDMPTTQGAGLTPDLASSAASGKSGYLIAQLQIAANAAAGAMCSDNGGLWTCSYQYNTTG